MIAAEVLGLDWPLAVLAIGIVLVGSATQASIGVGLGLLAAPTLTLIDPAFIPVPTDTFDIIQSVGPVNESFDVIFTTGLPDNALLTVQQPNPLELGANGVTLEVFDLNDVIGFNPPDEFGVSGIPSSAVLADFDGRVLVPADW